MSEIGDRLSDLAESYVDEYMEHCKDKIDEIIEELKRDEECSQVLTTYYPEEIYTEDYEHYSEIYSEFSDGELVHDFGISIRGNSNDIGQELDEAIRDEFWKVMPKDIKALQFESVQEINDTCDYLEVELEIDTKELRELALHATRMRTLQ